jgi:hypothetical protein
MSRTIDFNKKYPQVSEFTHEGVVYATLKQLRSDMEEQGINRTVPTIEKVIKDYDIVGVRIGKAVLYNKDNALKVLKYEFDTDFRRDEMKKKLGKI